jgi:hypothetical protein
MAEEKQTLILGGDEEDLLLGGGDVDDSPNQMPVLGVGGKRKNTLKGHGNSINHFDLFIASAISDGKSVGIDTSVGTQPFKYWGKRHFANELVWQQFSHFLAIEAVRQISSACELGREVDTDDDGKALAVGTAMQYFSNFLNKVLQKPAQPDDSAEVKAFFCRLQRLQRESRCRLLKRFPTICVTIWSVDSFLTVYQEL